METYWTAFYTKPRNEKKAFENLSLKGFEVFCPMKTVMKQWSDRKKKVKEVLFTSYIFCKVTENERSEILRDTSIVSSVFWLKRPVKIPENEIQAIINFLNNHQNVEVISSSFYEGQKVKIVEGPFKGETGEVLRDGTTRAILVLKSLNLSLQAELSKASIELVK